MLTYAGLQGVQGGSLRNTQSAALRLVLSLSMSLEESGGFGVEATQWGEYGRQVPNLNPKL